MSEPTTTGPTTTDEPQLVVPSALVVPDAAVARLRRQYARRAPGAVGIATRLVSLAVGSSTTTTAERAAMAPPAAAVAVRDTEIHGAVLLQPGIGHTVTDTSVVVHLGTAGGPDAPHLVVDPGACAFDPLDGAGATDVEDPPPPDASAGPPYRWRPVVLFLATASAPEVAAAAAALANDLVALDVEPRLALVDHVDGPLLTRPCAPTATTVDVLRPDIVVALDDHARLQAEAWCADLRRTVLVALDPTLGSDIEIVPWSIDVADGRLRARIGDRPDPGAVARLVNRLCAGPVAGTPVDADPDGPTASDPGLATTVTLGRPATVPPDDDTDAHIDIDIDGVAPARPTFAVSTGATASRAILGLADHLEGRGHERVGSATPVGVDLLLVDAEIDDRGQVAIVEPRQRAPRATRRVLVVDPDPSDDRPLPPAADAPHRRVDDIAGMVTTSHRHARHLRALGLATIVVPHLRVRDELDASARAVRDRVRPAATTVGLLGPTPSASGSDSPAPARAAFDAFRRRDGDAALVRIDADDAPPGGATEPWCTTRSTLPPAADLTSWRLAMWDPGDGSVIDAGALDDLVTLALAGVPVVLPAQVADAVGPLADRTLVVDDPASADAWTARLVELADDDRHTRAAERALRVAAGVSGSAAASLVIDRLLGWVAVVAP